MSGIGLSKEEFDQMKQQTEQLQKNNSILRDNIEVITGSNELLQGNLDNLNGKNLVLNEKVEVLGKAVETLQHSENEIKNLIDKLSDKIQAGADQDLKIQVKKLEQPLADTQSEIESLMKRLNTLEYRLKQVPTSGIFSYIDAEAEQSLFIQKVEEALALELTYAQINDYLSKNLPAKLDKILKEHPALTKKFIRNLRRD